jgi:glycine cleavage system H protein
MKYYSETHEWAELADNRAKIGISEFAQKELGDIVYVELPQVGKRLEAGDEAAVLESTKAAADVYSPLSGSIVEVNEALVDQPELVNSDPEDGGWLYVLQLDNPSEVKNLMDAKSYAAKIG